MIVGVVGVDFQETAYAPQEADHDFHPFRIVWETIEIGLYLHRQLKCEYINFIRDVTKFRAG